MSQRLVGISYDFILLFGRYHGYGMLAHGQRFTGILLARAQQKRRGRFQNVHFLDPPAVKAVVGLKAEAFFCLSGLNNAKPAIQILIKKLLFSSLFRMRRGQQKVKFPDPNLLELPGLLVST